MGPGSYSLCLVGCTTHPLVPCEAHYDTGLPECPLKQASRGQPISQTRGFINSDFCYPRSVPNGDVPVRDLSRDLSHPPRSLAAEVAGTVCPQRRVTVSALGFSSILGDPRVMSNTQPPRIGWGQQKEGAEGKRAREVWICRSSRNGRDKGRNILQQVGR